MPTQQEWMLRISSLVGEKTLFKNASYRRFWLSEQFASTGVAALVYTMFLEIQRSTGSTFFGSLFAAVYIGPAALLVTVSGAITDQLPKREVMFASYLAWALLAVGFALFTDRLYAIYLIAILFAIVSQIKGAASSSARPLLVPQEKLDRASALGQLGGIIAQAIGVLILPFVFLTTLGASALAAFCVPLFVAAALEVSRIRKIGGKMESARTVLSGSRAHFMAGWRYLESDQLSYLSVWIYVLTSVASYVVITLVPRYTSAVLALRPEIGVFIVVPAVIGVWGALRFDHIVIERVSALPAMVFALAALVAGVLLLGFVPWLAAGIGELGAPLGADTLKIVVTMLLAVAIGFSYMFLNVADNAIINARIPREMQGRVFSGQSVFSNLASVPPILLAGIGADVIGVAPVLVITGAVCGGAGIYVFARHGVRQALARGRRGAEPPPRDVPEQTAPTPQQQVGPVDEPR
ncbi:MAG: MFS transporter [Dehalococcoidia bacterium]|nr:MFS transporter [Dehalococcoidia bacterium]